ncbi:MAG TPA: hypothetical protein VNV87_14095 [Acidimicrobiales bacterium]|nr:hypothetical protein [Acidimicrobiales bacterium]
MELDALTQARSYVVLADKMLKREVVAARRAGASWQHIATALGVTHQAARKRFGNLCLKALAVPAQNGSESANGHAIHPDAEGLTWPSPVDKSPS